MADAAQVRPFGVRFDEAIRYLQGKLPEASLAWNSLSGPVHSKVFTVAGATTADLARDLQQSLAAAKASGSTITQFRKDFDAAVQEHGWTYNGKRGWRSSLIFDTNMRSAHMAGRWAQIEANADRRPFLQYRTAGDSHVRPQHRQWNGLIFPVGDAFWQTHYPPNGWNCRCTVRAYSQGDLAEKNLQVSPAHETKTRAVRSADGTVTDQVPVGIDPGWDHNVGQAWMDPELALGRKLASLPRELQGAVVDKTITPAYQEAITQRWKAVQTSVKAPATTPAGTVAPPPDGQIVGFLDSATLEGLARAAPGLQLDSTAVAVPHTQIEALTSATKSWPPGWLDSLPSELRNYRAVVWDSQANRLLVVPQGTLGAANGNSVAVVTLQPNEHAKLGQALAVESLKTAKPADFADTARYKVLTGRL